MHGAFAIMMGLGLVGCAQLRVEGDVVDPAGAPIAKARVTVVGKLCSGVADAQGRFSVPCQPGELEIGVMQQGYVSQSIPLSASDKRTYPLGTITLLPIPAEKGLFALDGAVWVTLPPATLAQRAAPDGKRRSTCLAERPEAPLPIAREATLFANDTVEVEVFRLDADGCAQHLTRAERGWTTIDTVRPKRANQTVGQDQHVIRLDLEPGEYVVAPWRAGTFVKASAPADEPGAERFAAFLVHVAE